MLPYNPACFRKAMPAVFGILFWSLLPQPASAQGQGSDPIIEPVTTRELTSPPPSDWLSFRGNLSSWGYSALDLVDRSNVGRLGLAWTVTMEAGPNESA